MTDTDKKPSTSGAEVSPRGIAAYAWLYKKDIKFAKTDEEAKHKMSLVIEKDAPGIAEFVASIQQQHERNNGVPKNCPVKDGDLKTKDGKAVEEFTNKWLINFVTRYQPTFVDSKKTPLPEKIKIWSGDEVKVSFKRIDYDTGVSLRMGSVQLLVKNAGSGADAFSEEDEGYVVNPETPGSEPVGDDNGGDY